MYNQGYNFNPYMQQYNRMPQQPMQQPQIEPNNQQFNNIQSRPTLNGKVVDSIDVVKAMDIPMDGSISYFAIADGSAIVTKQLQMDGTSKITIFKPVTEQKEEIKYITSEDMKKAINDIDFSDIDDIKEELNELKKEIKDLKKKKKSDD